MMTGRTHAATVASDGAAARNLARFVLAVSAVAIVAVCVTASVGTLTVHRIPVGVDLGIYRDAVQRWVSGGDLYLGRQTTGPYEVYGGEVLYPPVAVALVVPFLVLPAQLWWIVPLGTVAWSVARLRPAPWTWPLLALCVANPWSVELVYDGNPTMWIAAAVALAIHRPWVSAFVILKPSLLPLALLGVRARGWWVTAVALAVMSLPLLALDLLWIRVILDARGPHSGLLYSATHLPFAAAALVAMLGRTDRLRADDRREDAVLRLGGGDGLREGGRGDAVVGPQERGVGLD